MIGNRAKICTGSEELPVEVRRKSVKILAFRRIGVRWGLPGRCMDRFDGQKR